MQNLHFAARLLAQDRMILIPLRRLALLRALCVRGRCVFSTSSKTKYLENHCGGPIRSNVSAKALAQAIMKGVPDDIKAACEGDASLETLRWLERLDTALDAGFLPEAFHEYTEDHSQWELISLTRGNGEPIPPQPGYIKPGAQRGIAGRE
ncbi:hypothetical protein [Burkholderia ubonensis]|uniref:hypothetical protein n=1 Tax=Burkholderia ubonensis TaxID=101571 RepID=UPI00358E4A53